MHRSGLSVLALLTVVSLALVAVPGSAQQPPPSPAQIVTPQDCPKFIAEINRLTAVRFDEAAASAKATAEQAATLQAQGKYPECVNIARVAIAALAPPR